MKPISHFVGAAVLALASLSASAAAPPTSSWSSLVIFGDSLSDTGNVLSLTSSFSPPAFPSFPGAEGRFSNGPVWTEYLAAGLGRAGDSAPSNLLFAGLATGVIPIGAPGGQNYAYGGARTGLGGSAGATTGLLGQLVAWDNSPSILGGGPLTRAADPNALYVVMAGANDLRDYRSGVSGALAPSAVAGNVVGALGLLANAGARHFLISTLPDLGLTPEAVNLHVTTRSTAATLAFNAALTTLANGLDTSFQQATGIDLDIRTLDFYGLVNQVVADAAGGNNGAAFGITNIDSACITPAIPGLYFFAGATGPACNVAAFSDDLHPSSRAHELLGQMALQVAAAPVPEPTEVAMMLAGLALIAGVRRRARATAQA
ncbi:MAG: SGNH/GDSL hydrolase family protein [Rhodoferax sp.]|jgi:outer membrane lipase/esterase|nr:SGNH/GDSL hydrolase family protein [Rhodoferax sp.]